MRIGLCGVHGTGKTTLVNELLPQFKGYIYGKSVSRELSNHLPLCKNVKLVDYYTQTMCASLISNQILTNKNMITDRTLLDVFMYTEGSINISKEHKSLLNRTFEHNIKFYDKIIFVPIEFKVVSDGVRNEDEDYRFKLQNILKNLLKYYYNMKYIKEYITVTGSIEERLTQIIGFIYNEKETL